MRVKTEAWRGGSTAKQQLRPTKMEAEEHLRPTKHGGGAKDV